MLRPGDDGADLRFESLGYAEAALASYATFARLKRDGVVPRGCRFQVSLPTPLAPVCAFVAHDSQAAVEPAYERAMADELEHVLAAIPHDQLALQWDTNFEFGLLEGHFPAWFPHVEAGVVERLLRISEPIPPDVELGFHFCHGHDEDAERRIPADMSRMVEIANALASGLGRPANWIHMPLPRDRTDAAFVAAARRASSRTPQTELYLGALHPGDTAEETRRRIEVAHSTAGDFGLATPCGWGRLPRELVLGADRRPRGPQPPPRDPDARPRLRLQLARGIRADPRRGVGGRAGRHVRPPLRHGREPRLVPQPRPTPSSSSPATSTIGHVLIDYSGGTGILLDRLQLRIFDRQVGVVIVDSSPKFLRVARRQVPRRRARRLPPPPLPEGRAAAPVRRRGPRQRVRGAARRRAHLDERDPPVRRPRRDAARLGARASAGRARPDQLRQPPQPARTRERVDHRRDRVRRPRGSGRAGSHGSPLRGVPFRARESRAPAARTSTGATACSSRRVRSTTTSTPCALPGSPSTTSRSGRSRRESRTGSSSSSAYADAVLGWVGGSAKVDGTPASEEAAADRLALLRRALDVIFGGRPSFRCCWTYIGARRS